jgi:hypothetical protein
VFFSERVEIELEALRSIELYVCILILRSDLKFGVNIIAGRLTFLFIVNVKSGRMCLSKSTSKGGPFFRPNSDILK